MPFEELKDHGVAIVGAGSGIGRATAVLLAMCGARVACLDRHEDAAADTAAQASSFTDGAFHVGVNVVEYDHVTSALAICHERLNGIQALVNCAGRTGETNLKSHEVEIDDFDLTYRVNLRGAFYLSRAVLPLMLPQRYGRILHLASIAGKDGNAGAVAYSSTKAGIIGMVKSQGKEYADTGITVNALAPAVIQTPMIDAMPKEQVDYMMSRIPMQRCGTLDEITRTIAWIISPYCSFTTGFTFDLSGGRAVY